MPPSTQPSLRILHLLGATGDHGGVLTVLRSIEEGSRPRNWENTILVHEGYEERRTPGLKYRFARHLVDECPNPLRMLMHTIRAWPEIRRLLTEHPVDIVHGQSRGSLGLVIFMAAILRRPVVYTFHARARRTGLYRWAAGLRYFHSVLIAEDMLEYYQLAPDSPRVSVIPSACSQQFFEAPFAIGQHRQDPSRRYRMVGVGSMVRWKNWDLLVDAFQRLPVQLRDTLECHLWGPTLDDPDSIAFTKELAQSIQRCGLEKQILLRGPTAEIRQVLRESDWLIHPTTNEPAGVGIAEAIAMGVPALVSASGGPQYTVQSGVNGLHFRPGDASDLAAKLADILEGRVAVLPPAGLRESVRSRSAVAMVDSLAKVYADCLAEAGDPSVSQIL